MIGTGIHSQRWDAKWWYTKTATQEGLGLHEAWTDGIEAPPKTITDVTCIISQKPEHTGSPDLLNFFHNTVKCQT
jgi:hypothetical protein